MNKETLKALLTGLLLIIAGISIMVFSSNDQGLVSYFCLVFGAWDLGDAVSNFLEGSWRKEDADEMTIPQIRLQFKSDTIHLTIPIVLSILVEMFLNTGVQRLTMLIAYGIIWIVYMIMMFIFNSYEPWNQKRSKKNMEKLSYYYDEPYDESE